MSPAGSRHGRVAYNLTWRLGQYVEPRRLGVLWTAETGFILRRNPDTVRAPDLAFVSRQRADEVGMTDGFWPGAPDLAVEVVSPNDSWTEVEDKVHDWLEAGSRVVVVLDPRRRTAHVYQSRANVKIVGEDDLLDLNEVVPGFCVAVRELFAN